MKKIAGFFFSARLMAVLLALFAISIAAATFIENDFGSLSARAIVYNARWFELLLFLGAVNLLGRIIIKKLYTFKKLGIFLFHFAFVIILAGAAITRYTGSEGSISIREGSTSNLVLSDKAYIQIDGDREYSFKVSFNPFGSNRFSKEIIHQDKPVSIRTVGFVPNAYETLVPDKNGTNIAEFIIADSAGRKNVIIQKGEIKPIGRLIMSFSDTMPSGVVLIPSIDSLQFRAGFPVSVTSMGGSSYRLLESGKVHTFVPHQIYTFGNQTIVLNEYLPSGKPIARQIPAGEGQYYDIVVLEISSDDFSTVLNLSGKAGYPGSKRVVSIHGKDLVMSYGSIYNELPFELKLNDFIIERYPGSKSPSSFESHVDLIDKSRNINTSYRIYMNNILKYRGYRFYQSSYDTDEKGTVLSVNHDLAGTSVTYAGYFILTICMIFSLFNSGSRFRALILESRKIKIQKNRLITLILICFSVSGNAQPASIPDIIPESQAAAFGRLLIQDNRGRVEPINTLSSELLRKLMRKSSYKGMNADQVFLGMMNNPSVWQYQPVIRATNPEILRLLGTKEKYHSFSTFFINNTYILQDLVTKAFQKKPATRTKFDNEIIRLDEKINICYLIFTGEFLRIFPVPGDSTFTWYSPEGIQNRITTTDSNFTNNVISDYFTELGNGMVTGEWQKAENILDSISLFQQRYSASIVPKERKISTEIFLNRYDIFSKISKYYGIIGFVLLIIQFTSLFYQGLKTKIPVIISFVLILMLFCVHSTGLGMRWYVSGHAPLSNGYEALTYVAWASVLAGLIFSFKSPLALSVSSILGFLILFVAHLSWMDPQITNLVPVLKSYWLVIHVATITASYGFLAMAALLAFINLLMICLHLPRNKSYIKLTILEISNTLELSMIIGLYLLTIGVFLGAVWANESWGRYWGWDPKETWALVTVLVYAFILHMRSVPGLRGKYAFNLGSLLGFSSVIMTYFGVNYYLSGMHSYAQGDPLPVPVFVYYALAIITITGIIAWYRSAKLELDQNTEPTEVLQ